MPSFSPAPATESVLQEPPRWAWLAFPPVLIIVQYAIRYYDSAAYRLLFESEVGIVELARGDRRRCGGAASRYRGRFPGAWLNLWVPLVTFACFYFAGEEA